MMKIIPRRLADNGQVCTAAKRFIVHEAVADAFLAAVTAQMQGVTMGEPLDPKTTLGPLSSKDAVETLTKQVGQPVAKGATNGGPVSYRIAGGPAAGRCRLSFRFGPVAQQSHHP